MLVIRNGDYTTDGAGGLLRARGREDLLERVLFRLTARRGQFPFLEDLGSRLWQLGRIGAAGRQAAAEQYVAEALAEEKELTVEAVTLTEAGGKTCLTVEMTCQGEALSVTLEVR